MADVTRGRGDAGEMRPPEQHQTATPTGIDPVWLSDTIGAIYDCALQPGNWRSILENVCGKYEFATAVMDIVRPGPGAHDLLVDAGLDLEYRAQFAGYLTDSIDLWGGHSVLQNWPLEEPAIVSKVIPIERKRRNRYYIDILEPRGFYDGAVVPLVREAGLFCYLGINKHVSTGNVTPEAVEALRLLSPHLRRAVTIGNLLDLKAIERSTFESVLTSMSCGVVLVDEGLHVVHANPSALEMLSKNLAVGVKHGVFIAHGSYAFSALQTAVRLAAEDESRISRRGIGVPAQGPDGTTAVLHVLPLSRGTIRPGLVQRAVAAIFVTSPEQSSSMPVDAISLLCDLTPAESQVFASLAQGKSLDQTAVALGIAKSTARTHLLRIFEKTGCKRQAELVALAARHTVAL